MGHACFSVRINQIKSINREGEVAVSSRDDNVVVLTRRVVLHMTVFLKKR
jgi:hypothetical protein